MANNEVLGPRKTMLVLVIVVGCFAVLWPRILSPMMLGHSTEQLKPNQFDREAALKQERPPIRGAGPHPALRERGRAIPPGVPPPPTQTRGPAPLPPHVRVRSSPLSVYYEIDIKPPPIPGMRPPLGSPGGPVPAPKSSMGFVMPIYTICIIVFFVYTLSRILFKRTGSPYDPVSPDPQFRRRVFRDDSRTSPDKLVVTAISGLVAEVQQQMEASNAQSQQRQDAQDTHARPYTNGTILLNTGPVQIIASEFQEPIHNKSKEFQKDNVSSQVKGPLKQSETTPEVEPQSQSIDKSIKNERDSVSSEDNETTSNKDLVISENLIDSGLIMEQDLNEKQAAIIDLKKPSSVINDDVIEPIDESFMIIDKKVLIQSEDSLKELNISDQEENQHLDFKAHMELTPQPKLEKSFKMNEQEANEIASKSESNANSEINALLENEDLKKNNLQKLTEQFIKDELISEADNEIPTKVLIDEAPKDDVLILDEVENDDKRSSGVKIMGMEVTAHTADGGEWPSTQKPPTTAVTPQTKPTHEADKVKSIFLETEIPEQARVLVDFSEDTPDRPEPTKHTPLVVSGKMTLSLIQDAPRDTPERDLVSESTLDDFTTASALTQPVAEKEGDSSEEEIEEEIEVEEIEEEIEEEEEDEEENDIPKKTK